MDKDKNKAPWYGDKPAGAKSKKTYGAPFYGDKPAGAKSKTKAGSPAPDDKTNLYNRAKRIAVSKMLKEKGMK